MFKPGKIVLMGSGETSTAGGRVFESLAAEIPAPLNISVLETPAGFELNASQVAGRVTDFLRIRLQNYQPVVNQIPARGKQDPYSTDSLEVLRPLLSAKLIFMGPGSPSYTVRQLRGSLAWEIIQARHRLGATLALASAATIAIGKYALPVYEIYKVGEDLHWKDGLDLLCSYGICATIVPHWNNSDGGNELDTSRCFMGKDRFINLLSLLPAEATVIGVDEHTSLILDFDQQVCQVAGKDQVHILCSGKQTDLNKGQQVPLSILGNIHPPADWHAGIPQPVWDLLAQIGNSVQIELDIIPAIVQQLANLRQEARNSKDWVTAEGLRQQILEQGWIVADTPQGFDLHPQKD